MTSETRTTTNQLWKIALVFFGVQLAFGSVEAATALNSEWIGGTGEWNDATMWSNGLPAVETEASVSGHSTVRIPVGQYTAAQLAVGNRAGDRARVELDGGELLLRQDSLRIGEYTDSEGTFVLNSGAMHCVMDVFVGAATGSTQRMTKAALIVRGGSFVGLTLTIGEGLGAESMVTIEGSRAEAVHALEFVSLLAYADPSGKPGHSTLSFVLDEHGVTPITIQSRWKGLRLEHDATSRCDLKIGLAAIPPREDVTLVSSKAATAGTFNNLPEGAEIVATYAGRSYRWELTYHGGSSGHDLVLRNHSDYAADAPVTHVRPLPARPVPLWRDHPVYRLAIAAGTPAFAGAEGYGAFTVGGRGGREIAVENLNDSGPGSLRAAIEAKGPRTVVFRKAGVIELASAIVAQEPFLTIDGSSAPGPGITLRRHGIEVQTHDVVLRHFRIRIGDDDVRRSDKNIRYTAGDGEYALDFTEGARNCIADHLSLSWSTNKILSTTKMADLITIQWCILSESLNIDGHGYASITGGNRVTWHHNLFAHNFSRNVRFQGAVDADFRNNVIYDWGEKSAYGEFDRLNYVGNFLKSGPSTTQHPLLFHDGQEVVMPHSLYFSGNVIEGDDRATTDNWKATRFYYDRETLAANEPFPAAPVTTDTALVARDRVIENVGATMPARDAVDRRIIAEVKTGTGHIVDSVAGAGGWQQE
jgi:pectate lyase